MAVEQVALDGVIPNATGRPQIVKAIMIDGATGGTPTTTTAMVYGGANAAVTPVTSVATSTTLKAANASRLGLIIANYSTAILYVLLGSGTASLTNYSFALAPKGTTAGDRLLTGCGRSSPANSPAERMLWP